VRSAMAMSCSRDRARAHCTRRRWRRASSCTKRCACDIPKTTCRACQCIRCAVCCVLTNAVLIAHVQDGTCNGLQHYAALGGDRFGAKQVVTRRVICVMSCVNRSIWSQTIDRKTCTVVWQRWYARALM
jgi:hypothetical protein